MPLRSPRSLAIAVVAVVTVGVGLSLAGPASAKAKSKAPAGVSHAKAGSITSSSVVLSWKNPRSKNFRSVVVRRASGSKAPSSARRGTKVATVSRYRHAVTATRLAAGKTYSFALFASDGHGHYSKRATIRVLSAPAAVSALSAVATTTTVTLSWRASPSRSAVAVVTRYAVGAVAPARPTSGGVVRTLSGRATRTTITGLVAGRKYAFAVWARDAHNHTSAAVRRVVTTRALPHPVPPKPPAPPSPPVGPPPGSGSIAGQVTAAAGGSALAGARVWVIAASGRQVATAATGADGRYDLTDVAAGTYTVCFAGGDLPSHGYLGQCGGVTWGGGAVPAGAAVATVTGGTTTVDASLASATSTTGVGSISGTVTAAANHQGLAGVRVSVYDDSGEQVGDTVVTAANGAYAIPGVPPSTSGYLVCFDASGAVGGPAADGYLDQCYLAADYDAQADDGVSRAVPISSGVAATGVDVALVASSSIAGTVTGKAGPAADVTVDVLDPDGTVVASGTTSSTGTYRIDGLAPSSAGYYVCFNGTAVVTDYSGGFAGQCSAGVPWDTVTVPSAATRTQVAAGAVITGRNAQLTAGGSLAGTVLDGPGRTVSAVDVKLFNAKGVSLADTATSDDGTYGFPGLAAGTYYVCVDTAQSVGSVSSTGYLDQCFGSVVWDGRAAPPATGAAAIPLAVGAAAASNDIMLSAAGAVSGTVIDPGGSPVPAVSVQVYSSAGVAVSTGYTDDSGVYSAVGLPAGTYAVCFDARAASDSTGSALASQCSSGIAWDPQSDVVPAGVTRVTVQNAATVTLGVKLRAG